MTRYVNSKDELKRALKDGVEVIQLSPALQNELKPILKCLQLSRKKRKKIAKFLAGADAAVVASVAAAPVTGGVSSIIAVPAVLGFAATAGVEVSVLIPLIICAAAIGLSLVVMLFDYDAHFRITPDGVDVELNKG